MHTIWAGTECGQYVCRRNCIIISGGLTCHLCIFGIGIHEGRHDIQVGFGQKKIFFAVALTMNPPPAEQTRKPRAKKPCASKPGPRGPNAKNRPTTEDS